MFKKFEISYNVLNKLGDLSQYFDTSLITACHKTFVFRNVQMISLSKIIEQNQRFFDLKQAKSFFSAYCLNFFGLMASLGYDIPDSLDSAFNATKSLYTRTFGTEKVEDLKKHILHFFYKNVSNPCLSSKKFYSYIGIFKENNGYKFKINNKHSSSVNFLFNKKSYIYRNASRDTDSFCRFIYKECKIMLNYMRNVSSKEIAKNVPCSVQTVNNYIRRAKAGITIIAWPIYAANLKAVEIVKDRAEGKKLKDIALEKGMSIQDVSKLSIREGFSFTYHLTKKYHEIKSLFNNGFSIESLSEKFNYSKKYIKTILNKKVNLASAFSDFNRTLINIQNEGHFKALKSYIVKYKYTRKKFLFL